MHVGYIFAVISVAPTITPLIRALKQQCSTSQHNFRKGAREREESDRERRAIERRAIERRRMIERRAIDRSMS